MANILITVLAVIAATAAEPLVYTNYVPAPLTYQSYPYAEFSLPPVPRVSAALQALTAAPLPSQVVPAPVLPWYSQAYSQAYSYAKNIPDVAVSAPLVLESYPAPNLQYPVVYPYAPEFYKR